MRHECRGHRLIRVEAFGDRLLLIVGPVFYLGLRRGRIVLQMIKLSSPNISSSTGCAFDEQLPWNVDLEHVVERAVSRLQRSVQGVGLRDGAREAVENE